MKRPLSDEEIRLWARVLADVRPAPGRAAPKTPASVAAPAPSNAIPPIDRSPPLLTPAKTAVAPQPIEPGRKRRVERGRDGIDARLDLHGFDQEGARIALTAFLERAHRNGLRTVLVITGVGRDEDWGVIRRRLPDWLAAWPIRSWVAGWSAAHRRHGGDGATYVALKRPAAATPPLTPAP